MGKTTDKKNNGVTTAEIVRSCSNGDERKRKIYRLSIGIRLIFFFSSSIFDFKNCMVN